jgi:integrase
MTVKFELRYLFSDVDRHGNRRLFVRRNGRKIRIRAAFGTVAFAQAYNDALEALASPAGRSSRPGASGPARGTLGWFAARYFVSDEFKALDPGSQRTRRRVIDSCLAEPHRDDDPEPMANCPLEYLTSRKIKRLRDLKAGLPGAANNRRKYLSSMFGWAIEAELMKSNPARDVRRKKYASSGFYTWTMSDVIAFENRHPVGTKARLALALLLYLGVRRGDLVRLGPENIEGEPGRRTVRLIPNKTRYQRLTESVKPVLPLLEQIIDASPCGSETFLETSHGRPFTAAGFGNWFRERCDEAGLAKCSVHGLRKIGATQCAENGATEHQLMAIFDWSTPAQAAVYTRAASRRLLAANSMHLLEPKGLH